jgi:hypothetical protein
LTITTTDNLELSETLGDYIRMTPGPNDKSNNSEKVNHTLSIPLGNLQYGQSRDIYLTYTERRHQSAIVEIQLDYNPIDGLKSVLHATRGMNERSFIPSYEATYHGFRVKVCSFLSTLYPVNGKNGEHENLPVHDLPMKREELEAIINEYKSKQLTDEYNLSLLEDLCGDSPCGQIRLAISTNTFYSRWGKHYLPSLQNAYAKQICNSFKDPGPLQFGKDSPLFNACRDKLDMAFDSLPPPKPSVVIKDGKGNAVNGYVNMSSYHRRGNPCFAAECQIKIEDGTTIFVDKLRKGTSVWTPAGSRLVAEVIATEVKNQEMCVIGEYLVITPWHPICTDGKWKHPNDIAERRITYSGIIYSLLLEADECREAHGVEVGGVLAVTLGHGVTALEPADARSHNFWGNYGKVLGSVKALPVREGEVRISQGTGRDRTSGLVIGFLGENSRGQEGQDQKRETSAVLGLLCAAA